MSGERLATRVVVQYYHIICGSNAHRSRTEHAKDFGHCPTRLVRSHGMRLMTVGTKCRQRRRRRQDDAWLVALTIILCTTRSTLLVQCRKLSASVCSTIEICAAARRCAGVLEHISGTLNTCPPPPFRLRSICAHMLVA